MNPDLLQILSTLDPITAVCYWAVTTGTVTPEIIELAQYSPAWDDYTWVRALGGGNPSQIPALTEFVHEELTREMGGEK